MSAAYERVKRCAAFVRAKTEFVPRTALVLGSGLGGFGDRVQVQDVVEYRDIPGFPVSTVPGHQGRFLFGTVGGEPVAVMQGRVHFYEGYPMEEVVLPLRVLHELGCTRLVLTNAAGGIGADLESGCLMLLTDHIASFVPSALLGPNLEELGTRFPDMSEVYSKRFRALAKEAAGELGIPLKEGVYLQTTGPNYETPAEIHLYRAVGASAVGMSTACEAMAARHMGMEICGISCITNLAAGLGSGPLSHEEVQETADRVGGQFQDLVERLLQKLAALD